MSDRTLNRDLRARLIRPRWWDLAGRRRWRAVKSGSVVVSDLGLSPGAAVIIEPVTDQDHWYVRAVT
jgi:hypothetical protein